jgi:hypothetical protein
MPRGRLWRHFLGLLSAVLQFALPLGVSYADARLAADGSGVRAHVESDRSSNCRTVHSPECGLCRFLANHSATTIAPTAVVDARGTSCVALPCAPEFARAAARELPQSRGPPNS